MGRSKGRKAGRQADRKKRREGGAGRGGPAPTALTLKCSVMTVNTSSKAAPLRKGMLIFLSSLPHEPFCFEFKTTLSQPSKRGLKWKATSAPWPCPTSKFTKNLAGHGGLYPWPHSKGQFPIATPSLTPCPYEKSFPHPVSNRTSPGTPAFAPTNLNLSVQVSLSLSPVPEAHSPHAARGTLSSVQLLSPVQLFATPWTAACQASLSITNSWSLLKLMSIESVMPSNHLILCRPEDPNPSTFHSSFHISIPQITARMQAHTCLRTLHSDTPQTHPRLPPSPPSGLC